MGIYKKIFMVWGTILALYFCAIPFADTEILLNADVVNRSVQTLLLVLAIFITLKEQNLRNKMIFLNFSVFFFVCTLFMLQPFMGRVFFVDEPYAYFLFWQYSFIAYTLFFTIAIVYLVIDLLFREFRVYLKYLITLSIVLTFFLFYFTPFFENPLFLYTTEETQQLKALQGELREGEEIPSAAEFASRITLQTWRDGKPIGDLFPEENLNQIQSLLPYLEGDDTWMVIFTKPMYMRYIYLNVLVIAFILLFFGYQYKKDPPQGAYIDKMMFLFLIFSSMETLHFWEYLKSIQWNYYMEISNIGQYITISVEFLIALFFAMRLKFITSVQGEFYEAELASNPQQISRWRDWIDDLVLSHFFSSRPFLGRFFQTTSGDQVEQHLTNNPSHRAPYGKRN